MQLEVLASEPLYPAAKSYDAPSRKLALGILLQAFRDIISPRRSTWKKDEDWQVDALEWFCSDEDYPGSFTWVCYHLHVDRSQLRKWLDRYLTGDRKEKRRLAKKLVRFQIPRTA